MTRRTATAIAIFILGFDTAPAAMAAEESPFARAALDVTVAVRDIEASMRFYTDALGFTEVDGFSMPARIAEAIGLNRGEEMRVRVLVAEDENTATRLKLVEMSEPGSKGDGGAEPLRQSGYRYITVFVADFQQSVEAIRKAGAETSIERPIELGGRSAHRVFVTLVKDPDGNWIELVGPKPAEPLQPAR